MFIYLTVIGSLIMLEHPVSFLVSPVDLDRQANDNNKFSGRRMILSFGNRDFF